MAKLLKKVEDYGSVFRVLEDDNGRLKITNDVDADNEAYWVFEDNIHPDHLEDIDYMVAYHAEELACLIAAAKEEFGF